MTNSKVDYSVYLVTGRDLLPPGITYAESLKEALNGGVTIVQIREKNTPTREFIAIARETLDICHGHIPRIPVLVNDRVDVALAVDADGIHLGQDDMTVADARKLLPLGKIIGKTCRTVGEVEEAVEEKVDYVGIGPVWRTGTKAFDETDYLTLPGVVDMIGTAKKSTTWRTDVVLIGGMKKENVLRTLVGCQNPGVEELSVPSVDGIALVSEIVASPEPRLAAQRISELVQHFKAFQQRRWLLTSRSNLGNPRKQQVLQYVSSLIEHTRTHPPLVHQITNAVVTTQSANITLAAGASPLMATDPLELSAISAISSSILLNIGTIRQEIVVSLVGAGEEANARKKPVVLDPVGVGASAFRENVVRTILDRVQVGIIKGNAGELAVLGKSQEVGSRGVDSAQGGFKDPVGFVRTLAAGLQCVVVMTGEKDYISDGLTVVILENGDPVLGKITGSGCMLGSLLATYAGTTSDASPPWTLPKDGSISETSSPLKLFPTINPIVKGDLLLAAITGTLVLTVATEIALETNSHLGPGSFLPALMDALSSLDGEEVVRRAKIEIIGPL